VAEDGGNRGVADAAEAVVRRLRGVQSVRVETDDNGGIRFVHVLGGPQRSPKVIAVDVVSALAAELAIELEPRQVRVAAQQRTEEAKASEPGRMKFVGLSVSVIHNTADVKVHLEESGLVYEGIASGPHHTRTRLELVADAALRAVEMSCDALLKGTQVDGVYSADPKKVPGAQRYEQLTFQDVLARDLRVMDTSSVALARDSGIPIIVFSILSPGAFASAVCGTGTFTIVR